MEHAQRARIILIGGDAYRLRALRLFLDQLGVFEPVAIATGGAGLNALTRQPWAAAVVIDDLNDMLPESVILQARTDGFREPFIAIVLTTDRARTHALYEAGAAEVVPMAAAPPPDVARAIARSVERQQLVARVEQLEKELAGRVVIDEDTGLYPTWRFDEEWHNEQARAKRRGGELAMLSVKLETVPEIYLLPRRDRLTAMRQAGRAIKSVLRDGDLAAHDGLGIFRVLMADADSDEAAEMSALISRSVRQVFAQSGITAQAVVDVEQGLRSE